MYDRLRMLRERRELNTGQASAYEYTICTDDYHNPYTKRRQRMICVKSRYESFKSVKKNHFGCVYNVARVRYNVPENDFYFLHPPFLSLNSRYYSYIKYILKRTPRMCTACIEYSSLCAEYLPRRFASASK